MSDQPHELLDRDAILERVGGDVEFLQELAGIFSEDSPKLLQQIRTAIASGDPHGLEHAAHTLKGSIANFGAETARETAFRLEVLGRNGDLAPAPEICSVLEGQVAQFTDALNSLAHQLAQSQ